jgi:hypothetical protein
LPRYPGIVSAPIVMAVSAGYKFVASVPVVPAVPLTYIVAVIFVDAVDDTVVYPRRTVVLVAYAVPIDATPAFSAELIYRELEPTCQNILEFTVFPQIRAAVARLANETTTNPVSFECVPR